jgi:hypothetical protein
MTCRSGTNVPVSRPPGHGHRSASWHTCAQLRPPAERANAELKTWRILRKLRCGPWHAGQLAKAIHVLQARETAG